jgi:hypothetical protein
MVAPIVNAMGEQVAIHKTFLTPDGSGKADLPREERRETCGPMKEGAVRLAQHQPALELIVAEGLESAMSATQLFGIPSWAAICANGIETLDLPNAARRIVIAADHDTIGLRAALSAQERWAAEGRSVRIFRPPNPGEDFNDVLLPRGF